MPQPRPTSARATLSRRRLLAGGSTALGALLLSACGSEPEEAPASSAASSPSPEPTRPAPDVSGPPPAGKPVAWKDVKKVPHLFFHSLVVDPERAFAAEKKDGYLDFMVTVDEFTAILPQLWTRGYVLVSPHELYEVGADDVVRPRTLMVPENRTPLIISLDDCSYYEYMDGDGFAERLVIDDDGRVRTRYTDAAGSTEIGAHDVVPLLDDFVAEHPDFTLNGARGVLAMTGYEGVFGYRTSAREFGDSPTFEEDTAAATEVAQALLDSGWEFASHTWGHPSLREVDMDRIEFDMDLYHAEVEPILGPTDMLIYPFGADIAGLEKYAGEKYEHLRGLGYRSFFLVDGSTPAWGQLEPGYYRGSRLNVDGISMSRALDGSLPTLEEFFDVASVVDPARPESVRGAAPAGAGDPGAGPVG